MTALRTSLRALALLALTASAAQAQVDLALSKTASAANVPVGSQVTFTIGINNPTNTNVNNLTVSDVLPAGLTFVSATATRGTYDSATGVWAVTRARRGVTETLSIVATVTATGTITNQAQITNSGSEVDPNTANNAASASIVGVQPVAKSGLALRSAYEGRIGYTVAAGTFRTEPNTGNACAVSTTSSVNLAGIPAGATVREARLYWAGSGSTPDGSVTLDGAGFTDVTPLADGYDIDATQRLNYFQGSADVTGAVTAKRNGTYTLTNLTVVNADVTTTTPTQPYCSTAAVVKAWSIYVIYEDPTILRSRRVNLYDGFEVAVNEALQAAVDQFQTPSTAEFSVAYVVWEGDAAQGTGESVSFTPGGGAPIILDNTDPFNSIPRAGDGTEGAEVPGVDLDRYDTTGLIPAGTTSGALELQAATNDLVILSSAALQMPSLSSDIAVALSTTNPTPPIGGQTTVTVNLSNLGPDPSAAVTVDVPIPAGYTLVSATPGQGSYNAATGVWTLSGGLPVSGSAQLQLVLQPTVDPPATITATATAASRIDEDDTNDSASLVLDARQTVADLSVAVGVDDAAPEFGQDVTFTVDLANAGPAPSGGSTVRLGLSGDLTFVGFAGAGTYNAATDTWTPGPLAVGGSATATITATVSGPAAGALTAEVMTASDPDADSTPGNGVAAEDDQDAASVTPALPDLAVSVAASDPAPPLGGTVTFATTLANEGAGAASGVDLAALLPAGYTFVSATPSQGTYNSATGTWTAGAVAAGGSATLALVAIPTATAPATFSAEVTAQDQPDADSVPDDGTGDDAASVTVQATPPDLALTVSASQMAVTLGQTVSFTVDLSNEAAAAASGITVDALLPAGLSFVSASASQGAYDEASGDWSVGSLAGGASASLTITATVVAAGPATVTAEVTAMNQPDADSAPANGVPAEDDQDSVTVTGQTIDLALAVSVDDPSPLFGDAVTFSIDLTNAGPADATGVTVRAPLPAGYTFVSATPGASYDAATGLWTVGSLAGGASTLLTITATVDAPAPAALSAQVWTADQPDADSAPGNGVATEDDQDSVALAVDYVDVAVNVSSDTNAPVLGETVVLTVDLTNDGTVAATGLSLDALLPAGYTFVSASASQGAYDDATGVWTAGSVAAGGSATLQITATADDSGSATFTAEVAALDQADIDSAPGNGVATEDDQDRITLTALPVDLELAVAVSEPAPDFGETVTFTVTLTDAGAADATGVNVSALLPAGYTFVSSAASQGAYSSATGTWSAGSLAAGSSATLQITASAQTLAASAFTAEISALDQTDADSTPGNGDPAEDDQASVAVQAQPIDLALSGTVSNATPALGQQVTFALSLVNDGPADASGVTVQAPLPAGYTFVSATPGASYNALTGVWTVGSLAAGATATLDLVATANTTAARTLVAEVAAADQPDADSVPSDGTGDDRVAIAAQAQPTDLALAVSVDDATPPVGGTVTFTVSLDNQSGTPASGIRVAALLPAGLRFVSATPSQGSYDTATGSWTVGSLTGGASASLTVTGTVTGTAPATLTAQVSATDQPDADSAPGNNAPAEDDQDSATVTGQPTDLALAVAVSDAAPSYGDNVTFTVTLDNESATTASSIAVATRLPAGYAVVSSAASAGTYNAGSGSWTLGTLAGGASATLTLVATAQTTAASTFTAEVTAAAPLDADSAPGNGDPAEDDQASVAIAAQPIDLAVSLVASTATPAVGDDVTFTVTLANEGATDASGIVVDALLPGGFVIVSQSPAQGSYDAVGGAWTVGSLAAGASTTLTLVATASTAGTGTASAQVSAADQPDADSVPADGAGDDFAAVPITAQTIDLNLAAAVSDATPALGTDVTFSLTLGNAGPADATGITVYAPIPAGYTFVSASAGASYDAATGTWTVGPLAGGASLTLDLVVTVASISPGAFSAQVSAADQPDPDSVPGNSDPAEDDQASAPVTVVSVDLTLAASVDAPTPAPGQTVTFLVDLANEGAVDATGVVVSAPLPAGFAFVSASGGAGYDAATGTWTVGAMAAGAEETLVLVATAGTTAGTLSAQVTAQDQPDADSVPADGVGDDADTISVTPQAVDLALAMTVDEPTPAAGDVVTFTVTLSNDGTLTATGVQVADYVQAQPGLVEVIGVTPSAGTFDGTIWDVGSLAPGAFETLVVQVRLLADNVAFSNLAEVAAADQTDVDSAPYNGATFEDDYASATATTGGSSSGGEGGLESNGSLSQAIASVLFDRRAEAAVLADAGIDLAEAPFVAARRGGSGGDLRGVIPVTGPQGAPAVEVSPTDLLPVTNARDVVAADYLRADGRRLGVVFGTATAPGEIYEHTKPVCDRLRGAALDAVELVDVGGHPFVLVRLLQADGSVDYAVSFVAYGTAAERTVDSRFLIGEYDAAATASGDDVFNLQVWSPSREHTVALAGEVLQRLAAAGPLAFRNQWTPGPAPASTGVLRQRAGDPSRPDLPTVFVRTAEYAEGRVALDVYNAGGARSLRVTGGTLARVEGGSRAEFDRTVEIAAGTPEAPVVEVALETGFLFDVAFFVESDLSAAPDRLYLADGAWGVAADRSSENTAITEFRVRPQPDEAGALRQGQRLVERPVATLGRVATWATLYRSLRAGGQPLDLSGYRYVEFTASGEGEVHLLVQKASIRSADQYGAMLRLTPEPQTVRVWFEDLALADGTRGFTAADVTALSLTRRSDGTPVPFDVAVSDLRFGGAEGDEQAAPQESVLWPAMPNPFRGSARVRFELAEAGPVRLRVFDVLGRQVAVLADGEFAAGRHTSRFDASGLAAGIYAMRLELDGRALTQRMTVVR